ncbi:MAG: long-chain fatty acid--CoA ligase [Candidatus Dormibacteraeota bacterium]|nr:long-chain fatty acid--CoA ligase [Candidatus Dormibacteraeota bacterium]
MMDVQLNSWLLFDHARRHNASVPVVTRHASGVVHRSTHGQVTARAHRLMHALESLGLQPGDRVATLAWNNQRHLECYIGVPSVRLVLHTLNIRLSPEELAFIIEDSGDSVILADSDQLPLLEQVAQLGGLRGVRQVIALADRVPETSLPNVVAYEDLIAPFPDVHEPMQIEEHEPFGMCYTSGTTGRSKGVVYTHRSVYLHTMAVTSACGMAMGPGDCALPVVPMFHAMAWGVPHTAMAVGAKLVFCEGPLDAVALVDLLEAERVTISAGVPTVWLAVADELDRRGRRPVALRHISCGGAQPPRSLIERMLRDHDIPVIQTWGMTETSPIASLAWPRHDHADLPHDEVMERVRCQAGLPIVGLDVSVRDEQGDEVPADGETMGDLYVRGPWVADRYWKDAGAEAFIDGWFRTGDVAVRSPDGYFVIADRTKDLIKSGGEWISSVDMENAIMSLPGVVEAAVVAMPDEKWLERPLAAVVLKPGATLSLEDLRSSLAERGFAKWQLPDRLELIDEVPRTSVGKFDKKVLRARFSGVPV